MNSGSGNQAGEVGDHGGADEGDLGEDASGEGDGDGCCGVGRRCNPTVDPMKLGSNMGHPDFLGDLGDEVG